MFNIDNYNNQDLYTKESVTNNKPVFKNFFENYRIYTKSTISVFEESKQAG